MLGAMLLAFVLVVVIPVGVMLSGAVVASLLGWSLRNEGEAVNSGSELVEYNT